MRNMREQYERYLLGVKDLARDRRVRTKDIDRINIRKREISSNLEGGILDLLRAQ